MPNLVPPKIPGGERVDFDVSGGWAGGGARAPDQRGRAFTRGWGAGCSGRSPAQARQALSWVQAPGPPGGLGR